MSTGGPPLKDRTLAHPIQNALAAWINAVAAQSIPFVILRGHERLPEGAGFDLDLLVETSALETVLHLGQRIGSDAGCLAVTRRKDHGGKLLWLYIDEDGARRRWLLLDVQTRLTFRQDLRFFATDIDVHWQSRNGLWLPVPDTAWRTMLALLHALKKGAVKPDDRHWLCESVRQNAVRAHVAQYLGAEAVDQFSEVIVTNDPVARDRALRTLGQRLGVVPYRRADAPPKGIRQRLSRLLFYRLFFIHRHRPPVFVVTGPDGVGKSTLIGELQKILASFPLAIDRVHHLADTKGAIWYRCSGATAAPRRGLPYRLVRTVWHRLVPGWVKAAIVGVQGELRYAYRLNGLTGDAFFAGRLCLADRYAYDRKIKLEIEGRHPLQRLAAWLNCWLMRRPRLTILLCDDPKLIHVRKQELSVGQIADYQTQLARLCRQVGAPSVEVNVKDRTPEAIAREVAGLVLDALGSDFFHLVGAWKKGARATRG